MPKGLNKIMLVPNAKKYKIGAQQTFRHKNQLLAAFVIAILLMMLFMFTAKPAPVYNSWAPGDYEQVGQDSFIIAGWNALAGKFYKVDSTSANSGLDASNYEIAPAGFPIAFTFVDKGYGINTFNILFFIVDLIIWLLLLFVIIYKFEFFERNQVIKQPVNKKTKPL